MANKVDPDTRFSKGAGMELTGVPKAFLDVALNDFLAEAAAKSARMIDTQFVNAVKVLRATQD